jgi:uncharacterized protein YfdQ (DUF2303 family)
MVKQFLIKISQEEVTQPKNYHIHTFQVPLSQISYTHSGNYTGKSIVSFTLKEKKYYVRSWRDMLIKVASLMASEHPDRFYKVLRLRGREATIFYKKF